MGFAAAVTPMLLVDRFQHIGLNCEQMVLAGGASYLFVRFGIARLLMRYTVHRGMFHSIPALLIFTGLAFLICGYTNLHLRYFKAGGVFVGVMSHLMLDEIFAVEWIGGRWRFKKSFGTALKLWGDSLWSNFSAYSKLAVVVVLILSEPAIMERYGALSPIVIDNAAIRERLHIASGGGPGGAPLLAEGATQSPTNWAAIYGSFATVPTAGAAPPPPNQPDRTIYDTARRIWQRIKR
jgi:membrane-bound metal-dependent hydrolase YbcI (DUF457 family)